MWGESRGLHGLGLGGILAHMKRASFPRAGAWLMPRIPARLCLPSPDPERAARLRSQASGDSEDAGDATFWDETPPTLVPAQYYQISPKCFIWTPVGSRQ